MYVAIFVPCVHKKCFTPHFLQQCAKTTIIIFQRCCDIVSLDVTCTCRWWKPRVINSCENFIAKKHNFNWNCAARAWNHKLPKLLHHSYRFVSDILQLNYRISLIRRLLLEQQRLIRYVWVIQLGLIDAGSGTRSLSVPLSTLETSLRTHTVLEIAQWASTRIISTHSCAAHTSHNYCLRVGLAFISLGAHDCVATIWGRRLFKSGI